MSEKERLEMLQGIIKMTETEVYGRLGELEIKEPDNWTISECFEYAFLREAF